MPEFLVDPDADRGMWLRLRRAGVSASEISTVLGINPHDSAFALWHRKAGNLSEESPESEVMRWGRLHERTIVAEWLRRHPGWLAQDLGLFAHSDRSWQLATPDRALLLDDYDSTISGHYDGVLEVKTAQSGHGWGKSGTDEVPPHFLAQVRWQLDVMDASVGHVAALIGLSDYREYEIVPDRGDAELMRSRALEFLQSLTDRRPPPIDGSAPTTAALHRLYRRADHIEVNLPRTLVRRYRAAKRRQAATDAAVVLAENQIKDKLGDARYGYWQPAPHADPVKAVTRSVFDQHRIDTAALRAEHPGLARQYERTSEVTRLTPAKSLMAEEDNQ